MDLSKADRSFKFVKEIIGEYICDHGDWLAFLRENTQKKQFKRGKVDKLNKIKIYHLCS